MSQLISFINSSFAAGVGTSELSTQGNYSSLIFMSLLFVAFFYFVMWRPQNKKIMEHKNLVANLLPGDEIVTSCGIIGKITHNADQHLILLIGHNTTLVLQKSAVAGLMPKGTMDSLLKKEAK